MTVSDSDRLHSQLARAARGIPNYLIFDPRKGCLVTLWNPGCDGYLGRDTLPYGDKVTVETGLGRLTVDTSRPPVDPQSSDPA